MLAEETREPLALVAQCFSEMVVALAAQVQTGCTRALQFRLKKYFVAVAVAAQAATLATAAQVATEQTALQALVAVAAVAAAEGSVRLQRAAGLLNTFMAMELAQEAEQAFLV